MTATEAMEAIQATKLKHKRVAFALIGFGLAAVLIAALLVALPRPAKAADTGPPSGVGILAGDAGEPFSWTGAYVGVGGGYQVSDTELSVPQGSLIDGLSGDGWAGDARLGFDWQPNGTPFVIGVLGGYNIGEAEFSALGGALSATLEPTWYAGGRIGLALPTNTLLYGGAAYQKAEGTVSLANVGSASATEQGIMYIAGIEQVVAPTLTLGAEYSLARYEFSAGPNGALSIDPDVHAFKVRVNWRPFPAK